MGKHLSEDRIQYVVDVQTSKAQQAIHQLEKESAALRSENRQRMKQMLDLEAAGKKETEQYKNLSKAYKETSKQISSLTQDIAKQTKSLDVNAMSMAQLKKQSRDLQRELDSISKALNPKAYDEVAKRLGVVNERMNSLKVSAKTWTGISLEDSTISFMTGTALVKTAELVGSRLKDFYNNIRQSISAGIELAQTADGITHAFERMNKPELLSELRQATKGTINDLELMKAAVKAKDFRIPMEDLGKYLAFAQLKAQQTGQSFEYMVDSIVTGLGRESPMILDNLGLSAAEIKEQTKQTGDFMKAVASIVENQLSAAGETYISSTDRAAQRTVELQNAQMALGRELLPIKEYFSDVYGEVNLSLINTLKYIVQNRDTLGSLVKAVGLAAAVYLSYVAAQKVSWAWSMRQVAVSKLKAAGLAVENTMLELSVLRHAVLNKTMTTSIALQKAFNVVLKLSPWGLIIGGLTLVAGALLLYNKRTDAASEAQRKLADVKKKAISSAAEETAKIKLLVAAAKDETLSLKERQNAVDELNRIIPNYNAQLDKTTGKYKENKKALDNYIQSLIRKYEVEAAKDMFKGIIEKMTRTQHELDQAEKALTAAQKAGAGYSYTTSWGATGNTTDDIVTKARNRVNSLKKERELQQRELNALESSLGKAINKDTAASVSSGPATGTVGAELDSITQKIDALKAKRLTIGVGDQKALKDLDHEIAALEKRKEQLEYSSPKGAGKSKAQGTKDVASNDFSNDRKQDLFLAKQSHEEDLSFLQKALAEKRLTQEQYNAYIVALNIQHQNNLLAIEQSYLERSNSIVVKDAAKRKALQDEQEKNVMKQRQAATDAYVDGEKQYHDALSKLSEASGNTQTQILRQELDTKLLMLQGYYQASFQLAQDDGEKQKQATEAYEQAKAQIIAEYTQKSNEERLQTRQRYGLISFIEHLTRERAERKKSYEEGKLTKEGYEHSLTNLEFEAEQQRMQIRQQYGLASQQELYNAELAMLKQHLDNGLISREEYEEAVKNMKITKNKEAFDYYSNLAANAVTALQDAEIANMESQYDAEIEAARNAGKDTTELEKKKAEEKLNIQKKYADVNFAIKASQIIADTATSIMRTYADLGPIGGTIAAALMGVTGAAQLKAANAERQRIKKMTLNGSAGASSASGARVATGLEAGGSIDVRREQDGKLFHAAYEPDRRGYVDRPTVIVGEGPRGQSREWVASNAAVENPTIAPLIDIIDRAQQAGTIRTLDMNKVLARQISGRASGGSIAQPSGNTQVNVSDTGRDALIERFYTLLEHLSTNGIPASVTLDDIDRMQKLRSQARSFGSK
ncbi:MAG: 2-oxoacid:ferredoxin oxidoreductase subunit delta [Prevotellaceae bacterium]|nr:2-oxoacid:ferredoxin oxidoreductase subunit delta [Prevotellaceae bacterium]MDY3365118.1 2-oxoacid:ferredoxin oxidoreductase subunit delta [Prevotella sp.]